MARELSSSYLSRFRQRAVAGYTINEKSEKRQQKLQKQQNRSTKPTLDETTQQQQLRVENNEPERVDDARRDADDDGRNDTKKNRSKSPQKRQSKAILLDQPDRQPSTNRINKFIRKSSSSQNQMKAIYHQFGANPLNVIQVEHEDGIPSPDSPDHVVVKILASTVTVQDCLVRRGFDFNILNPLTVPRVPGCDMVGEVYAKGSKVYGFEEGDRVAAFLPNGGGNAKYITVKADELVNVPAEIEPPEAATMVSIYTIAYQVLRKITLPGKTFTLNDKKVLIILGYGRTDPIGHALIQMCQKARAVVLVTAPAHQHEYYRTVWNVVPLPDDSKEWIQRVQCRMDYVFDGLCEDGLKTSYRALKPNNANSELVCYGYTSMLKQSSSMGILGAPLRGHFYRLRAQLLSSLSSSPSTPTSSKRIKFVDLYNTENYEKDFELYKKNLKSLFQLLKLNKVKPNIIRKIPLSQVAEAQLEIESIIECSATEATNVEDMNKESKQLTELEKHLKHHGIIVCLPWMKDPARKKRINKPEAETKAVDGNKSQVDTKQRDKEEAEHSDEDTDIRGEILDDDGAATRKTNETGTVYGGATVCTDASSLNSRLPLLFCY